MAAARKHEFAVEDLSLEEGFEGILELFHLVKVFIVQQADSILCFDRLHKVKAVDVVCAQLTLEEFKVGSFEVGEEVFGWISLGFLLGSFPGLLFRGSLGGLAEHRFLQHLR